MARRYQTLCTVVGASLFLTSTLAFADGNDPADQFERIMAHAADAMDEAADAGDDDGLVDADGLMQMLMERAPGMLEHTPDRSRESGMEVLHQGVAAAGPRGVEGRYYHVCHRDVVYVMTSSGLFRPPHGGGLGRSMAPLIDADTGHPMVCDNYDADEHAE